MPSDNAKPHILILSTADWDRPIWTNKQHIAVQFAKEWPVTYVESLGLRRPTLGLQDVKRIAGRVRRMVNKRTTEERLVKPKPANVTVVTPTVIPFHRRVFPVWQVNGWMLRRRIAAWLETPKEQRVLWTFSPVTYRLEEEAATTVYHCVDFLGSFPGVDASVIEAGERHLSLVGATAVGSSRALVEHLERIGFNEPRLWENVADSEMISEIALEQTREPKSAVFLGNLTASKVDVAALERLLEADQELTLHLAGPIAEGGGNGEAFKSLLTSKQVNYHGTLEPTEAAVLMGKCSVGLVPYLSNAYTSGVYPMKVNEYLAAGIPVVCMGVPSVGETTDIDLVDDVTTFVSRVLSRATVLPSGSQIESRTQVAASNSWNVRGYEAIKTVKFLRSSSATEFRKWQKETGGIETSELYKAEHQRPN